ncbi:hypothetical protein [Maribacter antarcticus]|uniref:hypothetical protein n=1 Tax=Maribacter antarcticus TaxID=505250 RepID=UPI000478FE36|nr:hypothetical protein [Maribacter antarcticus]
MAWQDIPYHKMNTVDEAEKHAKEIEQSQQEERYIEPIIMHKLCQEHETVDVQMEKSAHGGGV